MAVSAAIEGCRMKRNAIGPLGRSVRSLHARWKFSTVTPCHTMPAMISSAAIAITSFANNPNSGALVSVIALLWPLERRAKAAFCAGMEPLSPWHPRDLSMAIKVAAYANARPCDNTAVIGIV